MTEPFQREERYIVVKRKHLTAIQETALRAHMARLGVGSVECVVVESDWPEYETVWQMIEARCSGQEWKCPKCGAQADEYWDCCQNAASKSHD